MVLGLFGTMFNLPRGVLEATFLAIDKLFLILQQDIKFLILAPCLQELVRR